MVSETAANSRTQKLTADERWAAWVAKGVEHDRRIRGRATAIAATLAAGVALWLAIVLLR